MALILAIESSCDETSVAITRDGKLLSNVINTQIEVHQKYGGVMPEIASRLHCENISLVLKEALEKADVKLEDIDAFAVTRGPGLIGALHVGMQCAKTLAMLYKKPLIPVHHLAGHIYANEFNEELKFPMLAVVVSGGNSELVIMKDHMNFEIIGETRDDAIGECYDKVARVLGLPYPGGIPIDKLAKEGEHTYHLPTPLGMVISRAVKAIKEYNVKQVVLAGGVSANSYLRAEMQKECDKLGAHIIIPPMWCCTDNAAMIAKVAEHLYDMKVFAGLDLGVDPNWSIEKWNEFTN